MAPFHVQHLTNYEHDSWRSPGAWHFGEQSERFPKCCSQTHTLGEGGSEAIFLNGVLRALQSGLHVCISSSSVPVPPLLGYFREGVVCARDNLAQQMKEPSLRLRVYDSPGHSCGGFVQPRLRTTLELPFILAFFFLH